MDAKRHREAVYDLRDDERIVVMALVAQLNAISDDLHKLIDGTLRSDAQAHWQQLRQALIDATADVRRAFRFNRW